MPISISNLQPQSGALTQSIAAKTQAAILGKQSFTNKSLQNVLNQLLLQSALYENHRTGGSAKTAEEAAKLTPTLMLSGDSRNTWMDILSDVRTWLESDTGYESETYDPVNMSFHQDELQKRLNVSGWLLENKWRWEPYNIVESPKVPPGYMNDGTGSADVVELTRAPADWLENHRVVDGKMKELADFALYAFQHSDEFRSARNDFRNSSTEVAAREELLWMPRKGIDYLAVDPTLIKVGLHDGELVADWVSSVDFKVSGDSASIADYAARYEKIAADIDSREFTDEQAGILHTDLDKEFLRVGNEALIAQATQAGLSAETAQKLSADFSQEYLRLRRETDSADSASLAAKALQKLAADGWPTFSLTTRTSV